MEIGKRIHNIFWNTDLTIARYFIGLASILWSILLFWPGDTFARPTYTLMGRFASEHIWALLFGIQGVAAVYSVLWNSRNRALWIVDGVLGCILWTGSCIAMLLSVYPPPAAISAEIIVAYMSWCILVRYPHNRGK